jgi:hypothetical protein
MAIVRDKAPRQEAAQPGAEAPGRLCISKWLTLAALPRGPAFGDLEDSRAGRIAKLVLSPVVQRSSHARARP